MGHPDNSQLSSIAQQLQASINQPTVASYAPQTMTQAQIITERKRIRAEGQRMYWTEREFLGDGTWISQPYAFGKPIGNPGYHWIENIKANDGIFYAVYGPNKGGNNRKYYNLVTERWEDKYIRLQPCPNCTTQYEMMRPGGNTCPQCGTETGYNY